MREGGCLLVLLHSAQEGLIAVGSSAQEAWPQGQAACKSSQQTAPQQAGWFVDVQQQLWVVYLQEAVLLV